MSFQNRIAKRFSLPVEAAGVKKTLGDVQVQSQISPNAFSSIIKVVVGRSTLDEYPASEDDVETPRSEKEIESKNTEIITEADISESNMIRNLLKEQDAPESPTTESLIDSRTQEPTIFWVHEEVICQRSNFFQKATNSTWEKTSAKVIELPDADPEIFKLYLSLLYTKQLPLFPHAPSKYNADYENKVLCNLYVLAESLQDNKTKNIVINALIARSRQINSNGSRYFPGPRCIQIIYEGTPPTSPARRLIVDFYVDHLELKFSAQRRSIIPSDFWVDVAVAALSRRPLPDGETTSTCDVAKYHCLEEMEGDSGKARRSSAVLRSDIRNFAA